VTLRHNAPLREADPVIAGLVNRELARQRHGLELIASENFASRAVIDAIGTPLTNKYAEGYPGKRYYGGCEVVDEVERLAIRRAIQLFGADHANVQPHAGAQANFAAFMAVLPPGGLLMGMSLPHGGHLSHGHSVNHSGSVWRAVHYGVNPATGRIDYDQVREQARADRPGLIICGGSAYARIIDFAAFRAIADEVGATLLVDMSHFAGLVAGGVHPSPVPHAQVVTTTTHKTLRGPRGGLILCTAGLARAIDRSVFPGTQGGPLEHVIGAKAVAFGEALTPDFRAYAHRVVANAKRLADALADRGFRIVSGGTDTHLMLVDLRTKGITGKEAEAVLGRAGITVNKNTIPGDPESPFVTSGIRLGTPALTTRGMGLPEMERIAGLIDRALTRRDEASLAAVKRDAEALTGAYPLYAA
jgi:glycine hydroxymethyltransferase